MWGQVAPQLAAGGTLSYQQARELMDAVMSGVLDEVRLASFLSIMAVRGLDVTELRGLADEMQARAEQIALPSDVVDIVGTGGDGANTVNISTMAAIAIAGTGIPVVKHGNRASTSASGSADVLEALGVRLDIPQESIVRAFERAGIAFLFANKFHPSMRHAARVRRELGFPTAFNILGPLTNPVAPKASVVGVARRAAAPLVAGVFADRGDTAFVFRGEVEGLDELSTVEPARLWTVAGGRVSERLFNPAQTLGLKPARLQDLRGGSPDFNAEVARAVFAGDAGPVSQSVAINAALGVLADRVRNAEPREAAGLLNEDGFDRALAGAYEEVMGSMQAGDAQRTLSAWVAATQSR